ncbi:MAG: type II toxin-antitoxin system VapC family toxin [Chthoniobacterales bacterium]
MILVDANLLVYAHVASVPQHGASRAWLDEKLNGTAMVGLPWPSLLAFARLVTNPRIFQRPLAMEAAWRQIEAWLDCPVVRVPVPGERHRETLTPLLRAAGMRANLVPDAHLAALAIEHGLILQSTDGDFGRFPGLRWENPLDV